MLVEASQLRVSRQKILIEGTASTLIPDGEHHRESNTTTNGQTEIDEFADEMEAVRELEDRRDAPMGGQPILDDDNDDIMEVIATQAEPVPQNFRGEPAAEDEDDVLQEMPSTAPPVFRPVLFSRDTDLKSRVSGRLRKNHEEVLEEQPKWALLAKVLKEIEDTIARVSESHSGGL
jgi:DNA excision repair protein ERCC-4